MNLTSNKSLHVTQRPFKPSKANVIPLLQKTNNAHFDLPQKPYFLTKMRVENELLNHLSPTHISYPRSSQTPSEKKIKKF